MRMIDATYWVTYNKTRQVDAQKIDNLKIFTPQRPQAYKENV